MINSNNSTINNNTTNNNTIGSVVNISINAFSREDIDHILGDARRMDRYVRCAYGAIPKMIGDVYFDPAKPENRTVRMPNMRGRHMQVYSSRGRWEYRDKSSVLRDMIERNLDHLGEHADSGTCKVQPLALSKFRECQQLLDEFLRETSGSKHAATVWKNVQRHVETVILNSRPLLGA